MKDVLKADKEIVKDMDRGLLNTVAAGKIA
jgi:hypothetical protein